MKILFVPPYVSLIETILSPGERNVKSALLIIPILFIVIGYFEKALGLEQVPTVTLALFHTTFNILGVLLVWPVSAKLSQFLQNRFTSIEEIESRPKFLDKNIAMAPVLSINAVTMEVSRIFTFVRTFALSVLSEESGTLKNIEKDISIINKLTKSVSDFITELEKKTLTPETASQLSTIVRIEQHMLSASDFVVDIHHSKEPHSSFTYLLHRLQGRRRTPTR